MSYRRLAGVQSAPRVMRGARAISPLMFDVPLTERVALDGHPVTNRPLGIVEALGWMFFGPQSQPPSAPAEIEMPAECARPGEVMLSSGVCGPVVSPAPSIPQKMVTPGARLQAKPPLLAKASILGSPSKRTIMIAAVGAVGLAYYLTKRK